jgi:sugar phosphate isomerase/epimerase
VRELALHQITAKEAQPPELVSIAAEIGCRSVVLFVNSPGDPLPGRSVSRLPFPVVTRASMKPLLERMRDLDISVGNVEFFPIAADVSVESYREALALGGELGANRAVTHIHDPDDRRAIANFGRLCDLAAEYGLSVGLEFMGLSPACNSIQRAAYFVDQVARPNAGFAVDTLHLVRTGGTPADVARLAPHYFSYCQLCDGRGLQVTGDYLNEALNRMLPGDGDFPLRDLIEALPAATPLDVEVPTLAPLSTEREVLDHARRAVAAARRVIESAVTAR